jgi:Xaa-Pro dipeptidase
MALFNRDEYERRLALVREKMEPAGVEVLVASDPANMNYLTGYDGWSFYVPQCVVFAAEVKEPIWIGRKMDVNGARHTTWIGEDSIVGYPEDYVQSPVKHPMNVVGDEIRRRGWGTRAVGVEMDAYYFTARSLAELQKSLPDAKMVNADLLVNWVRLAKSDAEIAMMKEAGKIAEKVMETDRPPSPRCQRVRRGG